MGVHDLGGVRGYGPVPYELNEPPFHADWERRVFSLLGPVAESAASRPGQFRYALERLDAADYFNNGYYGRWLAGFETLLVETNVISAQEMNDSVARLAQLTPNQAAQASPVQRASSVAVRSPESLPPDRPTSTPHIDAHRGKVGRNATRTVRRELSDAPRFSVGDRVVALAPAQRGHTRIPGYVVGKLGTITKLHPAEVLPDSTAHDLGERAQHVYCVGYDATTLWGEGAEPNATVHVDLYECYLSHPTPPKDLQSRPRP